MLKNVASQVIGVQMITAADGSEFTGSVTAYVTVDAGTQAAGSVSSGACTHEGHGYHTYAPAQAETNGALLAFTFVGSGAITKTVQVYTDLEDFIDTRTDTADTALTDLQTDVTAIKGYIDTEVAAIKAKTDNLPSDPADASDIAALIAALPSASTIATAVWAAGTRTLTAISDSSGITTLLSRIGSALNITSGKVDANLESINGTSVQGDGSSGDKWRPS